MRVELRPLEGSGRVTVVQQQASKLKQSLLQITDVAQLGTPEEVARLLLPPGTAVIASSVKTFPQPPRDTGTVMGVIERPPVLQYRYEVQLRTGEHVEVAVGVILGRVLLLGAAAPDAEWATQGPMLREIAETFKILPK